MIFEIWLNISYMVQLIVGVFIFLDPARKKPHFILRMFLGSAGLLLISFYATELLEKEITGVFFFIYWGSYIVACIFLVYLGLDGSFREAVYCAICVCAMQHIAFDVFLICQMLLKHYFLAILAFAVVYLLFYSFLVGKLLTQGHYEVSKESLFPLFTLIFFVWILSVIELSGFKGFEVGEYHQIIYRLMDGLCCFYVLWIQINHKERLDLQRELAGINYAWRHQTSQYRVTRDTIESINRKCHDLKHQLRALRQMTNEADKDAFFNEIEKDIMIFDTALQTGNKALDVVLMEKGMRCKNHNIQWSCMADGSKLDFMKLEDIYALFGNALDNAITEVLYLEDPQKRVISVKIISKKNLIMIQIQNYFNKKLHFEGGLPVTTKSNKEAHGYGMKSIRYTAEKYGGTITVQTKDGIFNLQILLPI